MTAPDPALDGSTRERAIPRPAARALVLEADGRVLLVQGAARDGAFWFSPGGGIEPDEAPEDAVRRELAEETGLDPTELDWGPCIWVRRYAWHWVTRDLWIDSIERFYVARLADAAPPIALGDGAAVDGLTAIRWWRVEELGALEGHVAPRDLAALLPAILRGEYPDQPLELDQ